MADYTEKDITGMTAGALLRLINARLRSNASVEILRRRSRTIMRTWKVAPDVSDFTVEVEDD